VQLHFAPYSRGYVCPETYSPADFFIRTLAMTPGSADASCQTVKRLCDEFVVSDRAREVELAVQFQEHIGSTYEVRLQDQCQD
jgi:hypothetical protein